MALLGRQVEPKRYEDGAEFRTGIEGWCCKRCGRFWGGAGDSEHMAGYCCSDDFPCACGGRHTKGWTCCETCRAKHDREAWDKLEKVDWDGETPLVGFRNDKYLFGDGCVMEYLEDLVAEGGKLEDVQLVLCERVEPRVPEFADYYSDELPECDDTDFSELEKYVEAWLKEHFPVVWQPTNTGINPESLRPYLPEPGVASDA
mgnify:CR=1 FL=1